MQLASPSNERDILTDGFITQAGIDDSLASLGEVTRLEFNPRAEGYEVILYRGEKTQVLPSTTVATTDANKNWQWKTTPNFDFLTTEPQETTDDLIAITRTLHGNGPCYLVPTTEGFDVTIVQSDSLPPVDLRTALCVGLAKLPESWDIQRAVLAFSAINALPVHVTENNISFSDNTVVNLESRRIDSPLSFKDVLADAFYFSTDHQLYFDARFPNPSLHFDPRTNLLTINTTQAFGIVVGTVTNNQWQWANHPTIRQFAIDYGLLEFFRAPIPMEEALAAGVVHVLKPLFKHWTHVFVPLNDETTALVLADAPALHLPPATPESYRMILSTPLPAGVDEQRATANYRRLRG